MRVEMMLGPLHHTMLHGCPDFQNGFGNLQAVLIARARWTCRYRIDPRSGNSRQLQWDCLIKV